MDPGLALARAISSCTLRAGTLLTDSAMGMLVAIDTPTKAVPKSGLVGMAAWIAWLPTAPISSV